MQWCCEFESLSGRDVQQYVIKFVTDLRQFCDFLRILRFPPPIKLTAIKQTNFFLSPQDFYRTWLWVIRLVSYTKQKLFTLREHLNLTPVLVAHIFSFPCFRNSKLALCLGSESTIFQLEMLNILILNTLGQHGFIYGNSGAYFGVSHL